MRDHILIVLWLTAFFGLIGYMVWRHLPGGG